MGFFGKIGKFLGKNLKNIGTVAGAALGGPAGAALGRTIGGMVGGHRDPITLGNVLGNATKGAAAGGIATKLGIGAGKDALGLGGKIQSLVGGGGGGGASVAATQASAGAAPSTSLWDGVNMGRQMNGLLSSSSPSMISSAYQVAPQVGVNGAIGSGGGGFSTAEKFALLTQGLGAGAQAYGAHQMGKVEDQRLGFEREDRERRRLRDEALNPVRAQLIKQLLAGGR